MYWVLYSVASDPFECLGEAVRTLTQDAEAGEMARWSVALVAAIVTHHES